MFFVREIRYLYYYNQNNRICSAGTLKCHIRDKTVSLEFYLKKLPIMYPQKVKVSFAAGTSGNFEEQEIEICDQISVYKTVFRPAWSMDNEKEIYCYLSFGMNKTICDEKTMSEYLTALHERNADVDTQINHEIIVEKSVRREFPVSRDEKSNEETTNRVERDKENRLGGKSVRQDSPVSRVEKSNEETTNRVERDEENRLGGKSVRQDSPEKREETDEENILEERSVQYELPERREETDRENILEERSVQHKLQEREKIEEKSEKEAEREKEKIIRADIDENTDPIAQQRKVVHIPDQSGQLQEYYVVEPDKLKLFGSPFEGFTDNSFLLHGYYNYHHILVGPVGNGQTSEMCIGVPGNYYRREEVVANMFGFLSFVPVKGRKETGAFGYYFTR